jgi:hypothetical protein
MRPAPPPAIVAAPLPSPSPPPNGGPSWTALSLAFALGSIPGGAIAWRLRRR